MRTGQLRSAHTCPRPGQALCRPLLVGSWDHSELGGGPGGCVMSVRCSPSPSSAVSHQNSLVVEIPPFRNQRITSPVQVSFYVCNGKRKRSQCQRFTYLPANGNALLLALSTEDAPRGPFF